MVNSSRIFCSPAVICSCSDVDDATTLALRREPELVNVRTRVVPRIVAGVHLARTLRAAVTVLLRIILCLDAQ